MNTCRLKLVDGSSFLLQTDGVGKILLAECLIVAVAVEWIVRARRRGRR